MMYYRISKNGKILFFGKKIAQVWAVTLNQRNLFPCINIVLIFVQILVLWEYWFLNECSTLIKQMPWDTRAVALLIYSHKQTYFASYSSLDGSVNVAFPGHTYMIVFH